MADSVQVQVNVTELGNSEKKLAQLSKGVANRQVQLPLTDAKGAVVDNLLRTAQQLNEIGAALADLIQKTETAVANARVAFIEADRASAQRFGTLEK